jgi:hypothetical protein
MHTALVQKLLRDRSTWELAHRCEGPATSLSHTESDVIALAASPPHSNLPMLERSYRNRHLDQDA